MKKQNKIKNEVLKWNSRFPIDVWWRRKHNIPFMSLQHKEVTFLDQLFEYYEDKMIEELSEDKYKPNIGEFLKSNGKKSKIDRIREEFENQFLNG